MPLSVVEHGVSPVERHSDGSVDVAVGANVVAPLVSHRSGACNFSVERPCDGLVDVAVGASVVEHGVSPVGRLKVELRRHGDGEPLMTDRFVERVKLVTAPAANVFGDPHYVPLA